METNIQYLKGVGEKRAALYHKLGIATVGDLLYHFPRDYIDLSRPYSVAAAPVGESCAVQVQLVSKSREQRIRGGLSVFKLVAADHSGEMEITIFNSKYTVENLKLEEWYIFYGKISGSFLRRQMSSPVVFQVPQKHSILPVYPQTAGLTSTLIRRHIADALVFTGNLPDPLPGQVLEAYHLPNIKTAMDHIHFPKDLKQANAARNRFIFQELLILSICLSTLNAQRTVGVMEPMSQVDLTSFFTPLPFSPTNAQLRCIQEAVSDMCSGVPMNRLVQGDVGSGKTLVVAACCYHTWKNRFQSAVMVPTEILAEQHYSTLQKMLSPFGVQLALLTGSTPMAQKRQIKAALLSGQVDLCIGTHALLSEGVDFHRLALVVTDEQHRFGVAQRTKLSQKTENCHVLVLSATPIPRTLSLIIYGDLKLSTIDELPPGRQPVETVVISSAKRERALSFVCKALEEGRQAYIVCPLVEIGEVDTGLKPAVQYAQWLGEKDLRGYRVGLLHGKMKGKEKEEVMRRFKAGELQVLVSTTVVEVGVDVPNATIILIENAERFGLSQLHQLRGRVGRGQYKSWCILVSDARGQTARERLMTMKSTNDGFAVAEQDLKLRGPGDFFGYRQHGLPELKIASFAQDMELLQAAQQCAFNILENDPTLTQPEHRQMAEKAAAMLKAVGERPN